MPHGTLANLATSAFVRTPPALAERIVRNLLAFPERTTTVLDPTAGEGDLLWPCQSIPQTQLYGVEISAERAKIARERLPRAEIVTSAFEGVSIAKGSMSLVLANPPYFFQDGKRAEYRIIADAGTLLQPGGIMAAIIPARSAWDGTMINHWCRWYERVRIWKFPDRASPEDEGGFADFTQICVIGMRRAEPQDPLPAEQRRLQGYHYHTPAPASAPQPSGRRTRSGWEQGTPPPDLPEAPLPDPYLVPETTTRPQIVMRHANEALLLAALERQGAHLSPIWQAATVWEAEGLREQPVMPLSGEAHVAAEVLTGLLDGEIVSGPGSSPDAVPHLFTAFVGQEWVSVQVDEEEREKLRERGVARVQIRQWQDKPILGTLNLHSGEVRYFQGDEVFTFLQPWLHTLAARVIEKREPLYQLDPADWELRVVCQFGRDKQLPHAAFPGLSQAQQHRVYAMGRALDVKGRAAIQGEPGTGKTRLAAATAACMAYRWRHRNAPLFQQEAKQAQPNWVKDLRRAWLKNPRTLALLGLEPVYEPDTRRVLAYRRSDGTLLAPEEAGPLALPVLISTPKKVTKEYAHEIRAAWPEAEVVCIDRHTDIPRWLEQCAHSAAPAVFGIVSHSLTRAFGREWRPVVREKQIMRREPVLEPDAETMRRLEPVYNEQRRLTGYRWKHSGELLTRELTVSHFFCPGCGGLIKAIPGQLHEVEKSPKGEEDQPLALFCKGQAAADEAEDDSAEPVTSRTWFTLKPRWCRCRMDARNRLEPGNPAGSTRMRTPLWTDARLEASQRKHPQLPFAAWSAAMEQLLAQGKVPDANANSTSLYTSRRSSDAAHSDSGKPGPVSVGVLTPTGIQRRGKPGIGGSESKNGETTGPSYGFREPLPDSFSPYDFLYHFYRGCVALAVIDESHNGRGRDTDIAHAHHQAMLASQTRMLTSGTHYGGDVLGFYHYWFRYHPHFWRRLGLGWNDAEKALTRYGVIQEVTKEYESDARKGSGQTSVQVSTIPAPGLSARLIPYLLEDLTYLTVLDVGAHMPPRIEIPEIVSMRDAEIEEALSQAEQDRRALERQLLERKKQRRDNESDDEERALQRHLETERVREAEIRKWAEGRHLSKHYGRLVRELDELAQKRNTAARLAKGTIPRWFAVLPCASPFG